MATAAPVHLRLYRHALESIFSHLSLPDLAHILSTCREWAAAVNSMRPIGASAGSNMFTRRSMRTSPLTRHVSQILLFGSSNLCNEIMDARDDATGNVAASAIAEAIKQIKSLNTVTLYNLIADEGALVIAEAIKQSQSLTKVNLHHNSIGTFGVSVIAEAIGQSHLLTTVDLSYNAIGDEGAVAIIEAVKQNKSLKTVDLDYNGISASCSRALAEAIKQTRLVAVDF